MLLKILKLPDISNWSVKNITIIKGLFSGCSSLLYLPDLSKWKFNNEFNSNIKIHNIFFNCSSLSSIPDISKWNIIVVNQNQNNEIFYNCK